MRTIRLRTVVVTMTVLLLPLSLFSQAITFSAPHTLPISTDYAQGYIFPLDLQDDGNTDLAFPTGTNPPFYVFVGDGKGGFASRPIALQFSDFEEWFAFPIFRDVNGDGVADAVLIQPGFSSVHQGKFEVWIGDGKGNFTSSYIASLPDGGFRSPAISTAADFNGDGKVDIAIVVNKENLEAELLVFLNNGDGTFTLGDDEAFAGAGLPGKLAAGDFNGDGKVDLASVDLLAAAGSANRFLLHYRYGKGDGTFGTDHIYAADGELYSLAGYDFNHDGKTDLVVGMGPRLDGHGNPLPAARPRVATLLAKQAGGFYWFTGHSLASLPIDLQLTDLNGDGLPDLAITPDTLGATVLLPGQAGGSFGHSQIIPAGFWFPVLTPLATGGLPALFYFDYAAAPNEALYKVQVRINTTKK